MLTPTPELIATARRVATREWTVAENEPGYPTDPNLAQLVDAGLVVLWYPPTRHREDYWTLNSRGEQWLAEHDKEAGVHAHSCANCDGIDPASCPFNAEEANRG